MTLRIFRSSSTPLSKEPRKVLKSISNPKFVWLNQQGTLGITVGKKAPHTDSLCITNSPLSPFQTEKYYSGDFGSYFFLSFQTYLTFILF